MRITWRNENGEVMAVFEHADEATIEMINDVTGADDDVTYEPDNAGEKIDSTYGYINGQHTYTAYDYRTV